MPSRPGRYPRPPERETLMASVGGYVPMCWEPPHVHQLPCFDPIEHKRIAECALCLEDVRDDSHTDILLMRCGHWVCANARCRPRRNREWVGSIGQYINGELRCPLCATTLEPDNNEDETMRLVRKRALRFPFCVARPSDPPNFLGRSPRRASASGEAGDPRARAPRAPPPT